MFVYSQKDNSFYKCLNQYVGTFTKIFMIMMQGWHELKNSQYFQDILYWIQRVTLPTLLPHGHWLIAVWTWVAETRVSWWFQIFHKIIICIKNFFISKRQLFFSWFLEFRILQLMMTLLNYFILCKIVLCIRRKNIFFCHHTFMKKVV